MDGEALRVATRIRNSSRKPHRAWIAREPRLFYSPSLKSQQLIALWVLLQLTLQLGGKLTGGRCTFVSGGGYSEENGPTPDRVLETNQLG